MYCQSGFDPNWLKDSRFLIKKVDVGDSRYAFLFTIQSVISSIASFLIFHSSPFAVSFLVLYLSFQILTGETLLR